MKSREQRRRLARQRHSISDLAAENGRLRKALNLIIAQAVEGDPHSEYVGRCHYCYFNVGKGGHDIDCPHEIARAAINPQDCGSLKGGE